MNCRSCGAPIRWVKTEAGKAMPLDAEPAVDGNICLEDGVAHYVPRHDNDSKAGPYFKSHFATCPQRKQWRKKEAAK